MAFQKLTLATIASMDDGRLGEAIDQKIAQVYADLKDRPNLNKDRAVSIKVIFRPVPDDDGQGLVEVFTQFEIKASMPTSTSRRYHCKADRNGMMFNELSPDEANQLTIDDVGPQGIVEEEETSDVG